MKKSTKVSIIVPVYNVEKYLEKCLHSLVNQSLKDIEIIIVNDGSPDHSDLIIDKFAKTYPNIIKTRTIENSGVATARNIALTMAEGEYIGFVDSDDYIETSMYQQLYDSAKKNNADIAVCDYYIETIGVVNTVQSGQLSEYNHSIYENPNIFVVGVPYIWNKIFKRSMIEEYDIKFEKYKIFEDLLFTYKLYLKSEKIVKVDQPLYHYIKGREESVTSKFSMKFNDVFPVLKQLKNYYQMDENYEVYEEYITYIAINHIYLRFTSKVNLSSIYLKYKYITTSFKFLNDVFPNWQSNMYFDRYPNKKGKNAGYWTFNSLNITKYIKTIKKIRKIKNLAGKQFHKMYIKMIIDDHKILIDSQHGQDINGNMFYLIKELLTNPEYMNYKVCIAVNKDKVVEFEQKMKYYQFSRYQLVVMDHKSYQNALVTSKFIFTDTSLPIYFIKKEEQICLNTWHGTPLKTLGRKVKNDYYNIANLQKNFMISDYLLYPSEYMMEHMIEDFMLPLNDHKILLTGYPRNEIFFDNEARSKDKKDNQTIAYMPTWRGTLLSVDRNRYIKELNQILTQIEAGLDDHQQFYLNVHPYVKNDIDIAGFNKIKMFPKEYETYDFLNSCDVLVTDYSSVFFDYALTRQKIILFTYDEEEYLADRGLYFPLEDLPFPNVKNVQSLLNEINQKGNPSYDTFIEKYCKYDHKDISRNLCSMIILNKETPIKVLTKNRENKNVLIQSNNYLDMSANNKLLKLLDNENKYNIYLGFITSKMRKNKNFLLKIPKSTFYMGQLGSFTNITIFEKGLISILIRLPEIYNLFKKQLDKIFINELERIYPNVGFEYVIMFDEQSLLKLLLYSYCNGYKILYMNSAPKNINKIYSVLNKYDRIIVSNEKLKSNLSRYISDEKIIVKENMYSIGEMMSD